MARYPLPKIVTSEAVPPDRVLLVTPGESLDISTPDGKTRRIEVRPPSIAMIVGLRHDCTFPGCQLSLGHPLPHCCVSPARPGAYLITEDNGHIIRAV